MTIEEQALELEEKYRGRIGDYEFSSDVTKALQERDRIARQDLADELMSKALRVVEDGVVFEVVTIQTIEACTNPE